MGTWQLFKRRKLSLNTFLPHEWRRYPSFCVLEWNFLGLHLRARMRVEELQAELNSRVRISSSACFSAYQIGAGILTFIYVKVTISYNKKLLTTLVHCISDHVVKIFPLNFILNDLIYIIPLNELIYCINLVYFYFSFSALLLCFVDKIFSFVKWSINKNSINIFNFKFTLFKY